jgi:hypothetical protein
MSWMRDARQLWLLDPQQEESSTTTRTSSHTLARRLIPKLIQSDTELPSQISSSYQLWVTVVAVDSNALRALWRQQPPPQETPQSIRRPGFSVPTNHHLKANHQRMLHIDFQQQVDISNIIKDNIHMTTVLPVYCQLTTLRLSYIGFRLALLASKDYRL